MSEKKSKEYIIQVSLPRHKKQRVGAITGLATKADAVNAMNEWIQTTVNVNNLMPGHHMDPYRWYAGTAIPIENTVMETNLTGRIFSITSQQTVMDELIFQIIPADTYKSAKQLPNLYDLYNELRKN